MFEEKRGKGVRITQGSVRPHRIYPVQRHPDGLKALFFSIICLSCFCFCSVCVSRMEYFLHFICLSLCGKFLLDASQTLQHRSCFLELRLLRRIGVIVYDAYYLDKMNFVKPHLNCS